ncbi:hypothetical protein Goarm_022788, partial [Gossypium armourianum]|nr:hypothetical protein [Gossypium armourianum]
MVPDKILYRLRQYRSRQFILVAQGLALCEFSDMSNAWNQTRRMKRFAVGLMKTPEYNGWWSKRVIDNILRPSQGGIRSMEEHPQVAPSEL